jgi:hypothetical protein
MTDFDVRAIHNRRQAHRRACPQYIWWAPVEDASPAPERVIAQVMNIGGCDDIRRMETTLGSDRLPDVVAGAAPGWISPRSWSFRRGRLARETERAIASATTGSRPRRELREQTGGTLYRPRSGPMRPRHK